MNDETNAQIENWRTEYKEVCQNHRAVTDFRGKLLTLLPLVSGTGIYVFLPKQNSPGDLPPLYLFVIGMFGFLVTVGLFLHEQRAILQCTDLIKVGRSLEERMGLTDGQFTKEDSYYRDHKGHKHYGHYILSPVVAAWIIYLSVSFAWLFVAGLGVVKCCALVCC